MGGFFASYFILGIWQKWVESPVYMSVETTSHHVSNIPFPAVSICSVNKIQVRYMLRLIYTIIIEALYILPSHIVKLISILLFSGNPLKEVSERPSSSIRISKRNAIKKHGKHNLITFC